MVKPIGRQIAKRECLARFYRDETAYQAQIVCFGANKNFVTDNANMNFLTKQKQAESYTHVAKVAEESLAHLQNISTKVETLLVRKHGDPDAEK